MWTVLDNNDNSACIHIVDLNRLLGFALNVSIQPIFAMIMMMLMYVAAAAAGIESE